MGLCVWTFLWPLIIGRLTNGQYRIPAENCSEILTDDYCIEFQGKYNVKKWESAADACLDLGGHLVSVPDDVTQIALQTTMATESVNMAWIGGRERLGILWHWTSGNDLLSPQGCYDDTAGDDLSVSFDITDLTPQRCIDACIYHNYTYAGLKAGTECGCGPSFGKYGATTGCDFECTGDDRLDCGGWNSNFIYKTDGAWGRWVVNQPNNFGGYQHCACLDEVNDFRFADEPCEATMLYVCDVPLEECQVATNSTGGTMISTDDDRCYFLSSIAMAWYAARADCMHRHGDLVRLYGEDNWSQLVNIILSNSTRSSRYHWIAVSRRYLTWHNGDPIMYANWRPGSPNQYAYECLLVEAAGSYRWRDVECDGRHPYFCEFELLRSPTTILEPVTTEGHILTTDAFGAQTTELPPQITTLHDNKMTSASSGKFTNIPVNATNDHVSTESHMTTEGTVSSTHSMTPTQSGVVGQSKLSNNKLFIAMIVLLGAVLVALVVAIVVFVCFRQKNTKNMQVLPDVDSSQMINSGYNHTDNDQAIIIEVDALGDQRSLPINGHATHNTVLIATPNEPRDNVLVRVCGDCGTECKKLRPHLIGQHEHMPGTNGMKQSLALGRTRLYNLHTEEEPDDCEPPRRKEKRAVCPECNRRTRRLADHLVRVHDMHPDQISQALDL